MSNNNSSNSGGEVIRISINSISNSIASHLSNLEGFSCTTNTTTNNEITATTASSSLSSLSSSNPLSFCDWIVTHSNNHNNNIITPRMIIIDNVHNINNYYNNRSNSAIATTTSNNNIMNENGDSLIETWNGKIVKISKNNQLEDIMKIPQSFNESETTRNDDHEKNDDDDDDTNALFQNFHNHAQKLQNTTNQYNIKEEENKKQNERSVNWDDLEEEEDEDVKLKKQSKKNQNITNLENATLQNWKHCLGKKIETKSQSTTNNDIYWYNYLLPPYPKPEQSCFLSIDNTIDTIEDSIRMQLETCDSISGFQLLNDSITPLDTNTSITNTVYNYIHDECKSSTKCSILSSETNNIKNKKDQKKFLNNQLLYYAAIQNSNVVLPINTQSSILQPAANNIYQHFPIFYSTSMISNLLHSISLPYRISSSSSEERNNLYYWNRNNDSNHNNNRISYKQYIQSMMHFNHYNIIETDASYDTNNTNDDLASCANLDGKLHNISNSNNSIDPLQAIIKEERNYYSASVQHEYHTLNYTHPLISASTKDNEINQNIIQSYQPKQYMSFSTNYALPTACSYWNHLLSSSTNNNNNAIPCSILSNSTRSYKGVQKNKNIFSKLLSKNLLHDQEEEDDDLLEILEFYNMLESSYTPSSILRSSCFRDDDCYFDDLE